MKIIHRNNFQNFYQYLIYLTFNFILKSMGNAHLTKIFFFKKLHFHVNLSVESYYTFFLSKYQIKLIIYRIDF
jgi:hypothetical protein